MDPYEITDEDEMDAELAEEEEAILEEEGF